MSVNVYGAGPTQALNQRYVDSKFIALAKNLGTKLDKRVSEDLDMNGYKVRNVIDPSHHMDAVNKSYVDERLNNIQRDINSKVSLEGNTMLGDLDMGNYKMVNVGNPTDDKVVTNKGYVDKCLNLVALCDVGLIPNLTSHRDESGFIVGTSGRMRQFEAYRVFNNIGNTEWRVEGTNVENVWISIRCPARVKIYRISIKAAENTKILNWKVHGVTVDDGFHPWIELPFNTEPVSDTTRFFKSNQN